MCHHRACISLHVGTDIGCAGTSTGGSIERTYIEITIFEEHTGLRIILSAGIKFTHDLFDAMVDDTHTTNNYETKLTSTTPHNG